MKSKFFLRALLFVFICLCSFSSCITAHNELKKEFESKFWIDENLPSLKETYKDYFDYIGFAVPLNQLRQAQVKLGLQKHASTITTENEFKPDFVFSNWTSNPKPNNSGTFLSSYGKTITVPTNVPVWTNNSVDLILDTCKNLGIKMRGHVLVWHSQTPEWFFHEDFDVSKAYVNKETMTARQEWYIKNVIEHVQNWERINNNGEHIIYAWDVVNEAVSDGASDAKYLREESSWYKIYNNEEFIVNAFRFANKYAASDVLLCYNDYNCTMQNKRKGMLKIIDAVLSAKNDEKLPSRIDVMGMQSHISVNTPVLVYEQSIKDFLNKGIDVQITELDIATESNYSPEVLKASYKACFEMFIKNRKTAETKGISSVTIWGLIDQSTWLNSPSQIKWHGNVTQYPLLFVSGEDLRYMTKPCFDGVIEAAHK